MPRGKEGLKEWDSRIPFDLGRSVESLSVAKDKLAVQKARLT